MRPYIIPEDENLEFLNNKIRKMKIAMFRAEASVLLCPPNNIITTLKTDSSGNIWFITSCNKSYAKNIDRCFFASLDYYEKTTDCSLRINGRASIIENSVEIGIGSVKEDLALENIFLIKLKILTAEYCEKKQAAPTCFKEKVKNILNKMFYAPDYRKYDFSNPISGSC
jgi:hypothetical protein